MDFPLTPAQIQYMVMPHDKVHTLRKYISEGVHTIEKHTVVRLAFLRETMPELERGAVLQVTLPGREWLVVNRATQYGVEVARFSMDDSSYLVPDFNLLERAGEAGATGAGMSSEQREELAVWLAVATKQQRLHEMIVFTLGKILDQEVTRSVGQLQAIWPMLCTLINNDPAATRNNWPADREFYKTWQERFRAPRRNMSSYQPDPAILNNYAKYIKASDTVLTAASLLAPVGGLVANTLGAPVAEIVQWERLTTPT
jgi:hypothetical protein